MRNRVEIIRAVDHALVSQGLMLWAMLEPQAAPGLLKAADHHRSRAAALIDKLQGRTLWAGQTDECAPLDRRQGLEGRRFDGEQGE